MLNVPSTLRPSTYPEVEATMLTQDLHLPVEDADITHTDQYGGRLPYKDSSFTRQMGQIIDLGLTDVVHRFPQAIFVTAFSAIPVAQAVQGLYEGMGMDSPLIDYINANRVTSEDYRSKGILDQDEITRLKLLINGLHHITIIDQYTNTRSTIHFGAKLLLLAGAQHITAVRGKWYDDVDDKHSVRKDTLHSTHDAFMHSVGRKAAATLLGR